MLTQRADAVATARRHAMRLLLVAVAALATYLLSGMFDRAAHADAGGTVLDPLAPVVSALGELPVAGDPVHSTAAPVAAAVKAAGPIQAGVSHTPDRKAAPRKVPVPETAPRISGAAPAPQVQQAASQVAGAVPAVLGSARLALEAPVGKVLDGAVSAAGDLIGRGLGGVPLLPQLPALPHPGRPVPPATSPDSPVDPLHPADPAPRPEATGTGQSPPGAVPAQRSPGLAPFGRTPSPSWPAAVTIPAASRPPADGARPSMPDGNLPPIGTTDAAGSAGVHRSGGDNTPTAGTIPVLSHLPLIAPSDATQTRSACSGRLVHHGRLPG
jgi:hypothetical protein